VKIWTELKCLKGELLFRNFLVNKMASTKKISKIPLLSLILNVYNEEKNVEGVFYGIKKILDKSKISYEIIFSESGSMDNSYNILKKIEKKYPKLVSVLKVKENSPGAKLQAGFKKAKGKYIGFMCSDGQDDQSIIPKCIDILEKNSAKLVKGKRINRENFKRFVISKCYNLIAFILFGTNSSDINGHPKIFPREILPLLKLESKNESIDLEIFIKCKMLGFKIIELPVTEKIREEGDSTVGLKVILKFVKDMLSYKFGYKRKLLKKLIEEKS